ncbi:MFS transporter [Portibacter marinus]|uniref:MFS transporter n=1 Tax=Portibacter marinus TaxID=2898660 RepID=UPI001F444456|nr:MFS transporter [Portibacter marinus]
MQTKQPFYHILLLILAGEAVFILPFVLQRIFRPTFLDLYEITNLELGLCFSVYGIVAVVAYFFGGIIADQFNPGRLMGIALLMTAAGGLYLATYPSVHGLRWLYGYWGMTTIFLFWAAMIKATRMWGGSDRQGKAFGFLDGGRGLVAAGFGSLGLFVLSLFVIGEFESMSVVDRKEAFQYLVWTFSGVVALTGIIIFFFLITKGNITVQKHEKVSFRDFPKLLKMKVIWLLMVIILTGYCGYKITDIFSLYAKDVMLYNEVKAAGVGTLLLYVRPVLGITIGFLADRTATSLWLAIGFAIMSMGALVLASGVIGPSLVLVFGVSIFTTSVGVYAIRSLYFAIMEEGSVPLALTGTAVGLASLVGYTPDIFMGPLIGVLLDNNPGELGHQYVFSFMALMGVVGFVATMLFRRINAG